MTGTGRLSSRAALHSTDGGDRLPLNNYSDKKVAMYKGSMVTVQFLGLKTLVPTQQCLKELNVVGITVTLFPQYLIS
jgi:hypothetical protein